MTAAVQSLDDAGPPPVAPDIFAFAGGNPPLPHLCGGRCPGCGRYYFPRPDHCLDCQAPVETADLGRHGVIYSHTTIRTRPPYGLPRPYAVALIDLDDVPLRVFCLLDPASIGSYAIGQAVALSVAALGHDGHEVPCLRPLFTPRI